MRRPFHIDRPTATPVDLRGPLLFGIGLLTSVKVQAAGSLYASDIALTALLGWCFLTSSIRLNKHLTAILVLGIGWLALQVITDVVRQSPAENYIRGWAKIAFFLIDFVTIAAFSELKIARIILFFFGLAASTCAMATFSPDAYQRIDPWKFGYATPVAVAVLGALSLRRSRSLGTFSGTIAPIIVGALNVYFNFRSQFGIMLATAGTSALAIFRRTFFPHLRIISFKSLLLIGIFAACFFVGTQTIYSNLASSGALGRDAQAKYEMQSRGDLGPILSGRSESLGSLKAISDSPFIGHGSWAENRMYVMIRALEMRRHGVKETGEQLRFNFIPSHSYLLGAWVEGGILGAVFWAACFIIAIYALLTLIQNAPPEMPVASFLLIQLLWDIPFSPFGADVRLSVAGKLCIALWALKPQTQLKPA